MCVANVLIAAPGCAQIAAYKRSPSAATSSEVRRPAGSFAFAAERLPCALRPAARSKALATAADAAWRTAAMCSRTSSSI